MGKHLPISKSARQKQPKELSKKEEEITGELNLIQHPYNLSEVIVRNRQQAWVELFWERDVFNEVTWLLEFLEQCSSKLIESMYNVLSNNKL